MLNRKILTIDGDFFGHRALHGLRITKPNLTLGTQGDMLIFENELNNQLLGLLDIFSGIVDNIIFVFDAHSWRKDVEIYRPYYISEDNETEPLVYKANRKTQKEDSDIDWEMFRYCLDNFRKRISVKIPTFIIDGLEGDDLLLLLSRKLNADKIENIIFCNDGDLNQIVNNNTHIFRNNKSKDCPDGTIVISKKNFDAKYGEQNLMDKFLNSSFEFETIEKLSKLKLDAKNKFQANRLPGQHIVFAQPLRQAFIKSVIGDKKDNIFPILRWVSKTGTRNYSVTEKMMLKVFTQLGYDDINDKFISELMSDPDNFKTFFLNLVLETKQEGIAKQILKHFQHNWKINTLSEKNIPTNYIELFEKEYSEKESLINNYPETLLSLSVSGIVRDSSTNILLNSTPDIDI